MKTVEIYRGYEIQYGEHKGRVGYKVPGKLTFNLFAARKAIDSNIFNRVIRDQQFMVGSGNCTTMMYRRSILTYSFGTIYNQLTNLTDAKSGKDWANVHQLQVI